LIVYSVRYVLDVYNMEKAIREGYSATEEGREAVSQMDQDRTRLHTALHDQVTILIRNLRKQGEDVSWAASMIDMRSGEISRARAGKFGIELIASLVSNVNAIYSSEKGI
jgi:hypothetical protein